MQLKKLETIKVFWNEGRRGDPRANTVSHYPDMRRAELAIAEYCRKHPGRPLNLIRTQAQVQYVDIDVPADAEFYRRWAGVTATELPFSVPATEALPAMPIAHKAASSASQERPASLGMAEAVMQVTSRGAAATAERARSKSINRGKPGEVGLASMSPETKRLYWRCMDLRRRQRKAGLEPVSWKAFQVDHAAKAGA